MSNSKLSILILTIPDRADKLKRLMGVLRPQLPDDNSVELIIKEELPHDQGGPTIGANRNAALADAIGDYVCFVDDDDLVPAYYIEKILGAIAKQGTSPPQTVAKTPEEADAMEQMIMSAHPDVIGFQGHYIVGESRPQLFVHSTQYKEWKTVGEVHQRCPNHLNCVKREIALEVPYIEVNHGEDSDYSMRLLPLLKTEVMIDDCIMYFYMK